MKHTMWRGGLLGNKNVKWRCREGEKKFKKGGEEKGKKCLKTGQNALKLYLFVWLCPLEDEWISKGGGGDEYSKWTKCTPVSIFNNNWLLLLRNRSEVPGTILNRQRASPSRCNNSHCIVNHRFWSLIGWFVWSPASHWLICLAPACHW